MLFFRMACKKESKLRKFILTSMDDKLFSKSLKTSVFKTFLEILKNTSNNHLKDCFSDVTKKKTGKYKKFVKKLLNSQKNINKRKKMFIKAPSDFRKLVYDHLICDFLKNCVDTPDD